MAQSDLFSESAATKNIPSLGAQPFLGLRTSGKGHKFDTSQDLQNGRLDSGLNGLGKTVGGQLMEGALEPRPSVRVLGLTADHRRQRQPRRIDAPM